MKVWIVMECYRYEGEEIIAVYGSKVAALARRRHLGETPGPSDRSFEVRGHDVLDA